MYMHLLTHAIIEFFMWGKVQETVCISMHRLLWLRTL